MLGLAQICVAMLKGVVKHFQPFERRAENLLPSVEGWGEHNKF